MSVALIFREKKEYEEVLSFFEKQFASFGKYETHLPGSGGSIAKAPQEHLPHLVHLEGNGLIIRQVLQSLERNFQASALIGSGYAQSHLNQDVLIPTTCLRSAGRLDFGGRPILYEELGFDMNLQKTFSQHFLATHDLHSGFVFSAYRPLKNEEEMKWVNDHLNCQVFDDYSAELCLAAKSLKRPVSCVKFLRKDIQAKLWAKYFSSQSA